MQRGVELSREQGDVLGPGRGAALVLLGNDP